MQHHLIANTWVNCLLNQLEKTGINLNAISARIPELDFSEIRNGQRIDINLVRQIWHVADDLAQDPLLGFKIGSAISFKALGVLAPILLHSPTPRHSLQNIFQYSNLLSDTFIFRMDEENDLLLFELTPLRSSIQENAQHLVSIIAHMFNMSREMGIRGNLAHRVILPNSLDLDVLAKAMQQTVIGADLPPYGIHFILEGQDEVLPGCDNHLYQLNKAYAEDLVQQKKVGNDLLESVKALIITQGYQRANVDRVTDELGVSKRSLQRLLSEEKTSFRSLKEEVVKERALLLIAHAETPIEQISLELGYSEVSAFHRAFKGWFGVTPGEYASNPAIQL